MRCAARFRQSRLLGNIVQSHLQRVQWGSQYNFTVNQQSTQDQLYYQCQILLSSISTLRLFVGFSDHSIPQLSVVRCLCNIMCVCIDTFIQGYDYIRTFMDISLHRQISYRGCQELSCQSLYIKSLKLIERPGIYPLRSSAPIFQQKPRPQNKLLI